MQDETLTGVMFKTVMNWSEQEIDKPNRFSSVVRKKLETGQ